MSTEAGLNLFNMTDFLGDPNASLSLNTTDLYMTTKAVINTPKIRARDFLEYKIGAAINKHFSYIVAGIGIPANIAIILTLMKMRPLTSSMIYIMFLAISDIIGLAVKMLHYMGTVMDIISNDYWCRFTMFMGYTSMMFSNWVLVALSVERFIAIWFPLKVTKWCTKRRAVIIIITIYVIIACIDLHLWWIIRAQKNSPAGTSCYPYPRYRQFYRGPWTFIDATVYSFLPFLILFFCNFMIIWGLRRSSITQRKLMNITGKTQSDEKTKQQNQITIMLITVSIVFMILTMPNVIFFIARNYWTFGDTTYGLAQYNLLLNIIYPLSDLNHAVNFYLYCLSGKKFREKFVSLICCREMKKLSSKTTTMSSLSSVRSRQVPSISGHKNDAFIESQHALNDWNNLSATEFSQNQRDDTNMDK